MLALVIPRTEASWQAVMNSAHVHNRLPTDAHDNAASKKLVAPPCWVGSIQYCVPISTMSVGHSRNWLARPFSTWNAVPSKTVEIIIPASMSVPNRVVQVSTAHYKGAPLTVVLLIGPAAFMGAAITKCVPGCSGTAKTEAGICHVDPVTPATVRNAPDCSTEVLSTWLASVVGANPFIWRSACVVPFKSKALSTFT